MPTLIAARTIVQPAGNKAKRIEEYVGRVNSGHGSLSVARMVSPGGWQEPGQRPEFEDGAAYVAVCLPAFSPASVRRDDR
jgi:hypothetical protein